jgi:hypothetical protein
VLWRRVIVCVIVSSTEGPISYPPAFLPACRDALLHISSAARCIVCCDMIFFGVCSREGHARFSLSGHPIEAPSGFCEVGHFVSHVAVAVGGQCDQEGSSAPPARPPTERRSLQDVIGCRRPVDWLAAGGAVVRPFVLSMGSGGRAGAKY